MMEIHISGMPRSYNKYITLKIYYNIACFKGTKLDKSTKGMSICLVGNGFDMPSSFFD